MEPSAFTTLLALLLAFNNPQVSLTALDTEKLYEVGEQLELDPDDWEFIEAGLMAILQGNKGLSTEFRILRDRLSNLDRNVQQRLLPTEDDVSEAKSLTQQSADDIEIRGSDNNQWTALDLEILTLAIVVLKHEEPLRVVRNLSWVRRVMKEIQ